MSGSEAGRARRVSDDPAAPSASPSAGGRDGTAEWDEWYCRYATSRAQGQVPESAYEMARRAFLAGWAARGGTCVTGGLRAQAPAFRPGIARAPTETEVKHKHDRISA